MALDEQVTKYRSLDEWFTTPQGIHVAKAFASELASVSEQFNGQTLLQLGNCGDNLWLPEVRYSHKWIMTPCSDSQVSTLVASLNSLPLDRDSVDCIIAPLTLEAFKREKNPIDEIDRVLKPMGYAIFFGINPWSFWGIALRWRYITCFGAYPASLTSSLSIKYAMMNRGYRQCFHSRFYYIPPIEGEKTINRFKFLNEVGKMVCPFPAGFYCFILQKHQPCSPNFLMNKQEAILLQSPMPMKV